MTGRLDLVAAYAGDLSWQRDPDRPPACRFPGQWTSPVELAAHAKLWDATDRKPSSAEWQRIDRARQVCIPCPVRAECLLYAMVPGNRVEGVWGGEYFSASGVRRRVDRQGLRVPLTRPWPVEDEHDDPAA
jgi:hypothetical protein